MSPEKSWMQYSRKELDEKLRNIQAKTGTKIHGILWDNGIPRFIYQHTY